MPWLTAKSVDDVLAMFAINEQGRKWIKRRLNKDILVFEAGHSLPEHRTFFDYLNYCWRDKFQDEYPDAEDFRTFISYKVSHYTTTIMEIDGQPVKFIKVKSWSFGKSHFDEFHELFKRCEAIMMERGCCSVSTYLANKRDVDENYPAP
jgi:hypothetical protein